MRRNCSGSIPISSWSITRRGVHAQFRVYVSHRGAGKAGRELDIESQARKRLLRALEENVSRYEAQFGKLPDAPAPDAEPKVGFVQ